MPLPVGKYEINEERGRWNLVSIPHSLTVMLSDELFRLSHYMSHGLEFEKERNHGNLMKWFKMVFVF